MSDFSEETTPLERALSKGDRSQLECFLKAGVDPNHKDKKENSILYNAVKNRHYDLVSLLLSFKANPHFINSNGDSAVHLAVRNADLEMCKVLLDKGASISHKNVRNQTPVGIAVKENFEELVLFFYSKSPEAFLVKENNNKTVLENSSSEKLKIVVRQKALWDRRKVLVFCRRFVPDLNKIGDGVFKSLVLFL
jgi:ankyrin repeat protein